MKFNFLIIYLVFFSSSVLAAGSTDSAHGTPSIFDLVPSSVNFFLFFSFLIWKLRKPITKFFDDNAVKVKEIYDYAEKKDREANIRLKEGKEKLEQVQNDINKIQTTAEEDFSIFAKELGRSTADQIERAAKDSENRLHGEQAGFMRRLREDFVDDVIDKVKEEIKSSPESRQKAMKKMLDKLVAGSVS